MVPAQEEPVKFVGSIASWFDTSSDQERPVERGGVHWPRVIPFVVLHAGCLGVVFVGWSPFAVGVAVAMYFARMFFITGFYHRYFSHRSFDTSRFWQFAFACLGNTAVQRGALWWAAQHRHHHAHSDEQEDPHSPHAHGLYWSHIGWLTSRSNFFTRNELIPDLARYPELRWLDRFDTVVPIVYAAIMLALGAVVGTWLPGTGTDGWQMLVWGFFISTAVLLHGTCLVNSAAHRFGTQRYRTGDQSRNSLLVALLTLGEGWHNNHHHYPGSVRQGFHWWEIDVTYYVLRLMQALRIVRSLRPVPVHALESKRRRR